MKKLASILLILILCVTMLVGCQKGKTGNDISEDTTTSTGTTDVNNDGSNTENNVTENSGNEVATSGEETTTSNEQEVVNEPAEKVIMNVAALKGPTSMGMVKIMEDNEQGVAVNDYHFTVAGAADEITAGIVNGDFDVAAIPSNLASVLYNKTEGGLVVAGINTLGVLYIVETGETIQSVEDLKGKTIYSTGKGTTPEYSLNYLLTSYGIDPEKDVTIEYKSEATEVAAVLSEASDGIAMLPQPYVTTVMMNNDKVRVALNVAEEWDKVATNGSTVVTGVVVINKSFLENNKEAVDAFLAEYQASADYVNNNLKEAALLIEKFDIFKAAVAEKALPYCNITFIQGEDMKTKISGYLETLFNQNPKTVGGVMPDDGFYYFQ